MLVFSFFWQAVKGRCPCKGFYGAENWEEKDFYEANLCLKNLAIEGKITVIIDGLDELGNFASKDVTNSTQASANPHMEVDFAKLDNRRAQNPWGV